MPADPDLWKPGDDTFKDSKWPFPLQYGGQCNCKENCVRLHETSAVVSPFKQSQVVVVLKENKCSSLSCDLTGTRLIFCFLICRFVRQCLSFLTALVSQGPEAAREVLNCIHINKSLSGLAKRKDKKVCSMSCSILHWHAYFTPYRYILKKNSLWILQGRPDVRMAFVQFVLCFLVSGDNATIGQVLEFKGNSVLRCQPTSSQRSFSLCWWYVLLMLLSELLPEILSTGIQEDRMSVVNLILSTLKTRVSFQLITSNFKQIFGFDTRLFFSCHRSY